MVRILHWPRINRLEATVEDRVSGVTCLEECEIEALVRHRLTPDAEQHCQAHLMWCRTCQLRVEEEFEFSEATRNAATVLQQREAQPVPQVEAPGARTRGTVAGFLNWFSAPLPMRWAAIAVSVGLLIGLVGRWPLQRSAGSAEIVLRSERGSAVPVAVENAASAKIRLRINASDLSPATAFQVAVVDELGHPIEAKAAKAISGSVSLELRTKLSPGQYWVRLSAPEGRLLREYALRVRP